MAWGQLGMAMVTLSPGRMPRVFRLLAQRSISCTIFLYVVDLPMKSKAMLLGYSSAMRSTASNILPRK